VDSLRSADLDVVTPFHVHLMRIVGDAGSRYGLSNLRLEGGTALAAFYLHHRESEDLDFFADSPLDVRDWGPFAASHLGDAGIPARLDGPPNVGMARIVAVNPDNPDQEIKIDLATQSPFKLAPLEETAEGIRVASYRDLCTGKLSAAYGRYLPRDFIDLHA
jgi:predicted nucleotidyltransferase component of viral defense system